MITQVIAFAEAGRARAQMACVSALAKAIHVAEGRGAMRRDAIAAMPEPRAPGCAFEDDDLDAGSERAASSVGRVAEARCR
jgi:hypothetical protein